MKGRCYDWLSRDRQHLDKVENASRNAVLHESELSVRESFSPKLSMNLRTIFTSQVPRYLGSGGFNCQKAFLALVTRGCLPIVTPASPVMWYLLTADTEFLITSKDKPELYK